MLKCRVARLPRERLTNPTPTPGHGAGWWWVDWSPLAPLHPSIVRAAPSERVQAFRDPLTVQIAHHAVSDMQKIDAEDSSFFQPQNGNWPFFVLRNARLFQLNCILKRFLQRDVTHIPLRDRCLQKLPVTRRRCEPEASWNVTRKQEVISLNKRSRLLPRQENNNKKKTKTRTAAENAAKCDKEQTKILWLTLPLSDWLAHQSRAGKTLGTGGFPTKMFCNFSPHSALTI